MTALRVAVLAESETDDSVAREVVAHVRGVIVEPILVPSLRARGWPAILRQLPQVVHTVYYQSDADALVVLADTDATVPHDPIAHAPGAAPTDCRWCQLHSALGRTLARLGPRPTPPPLRTAVGTPVPAVEAWLLAGTAPRPSEAAWLQRGVHAAAASETYKRQLKRAAYGAGPPYRSTARSASTLIRDVLSTPGLLAAQQPQRRAPDRGQRAIERMYPGSTAFSKAAQQQAVANGMARGPNISSRARRVRRHPVTAA